MVGNLNFNWCCWIHYLRFLYTFSTSVICIPACILIPRLGFIDWMVVFLSRYWLQYLSRIGNLIGVCNKMGSEGPTPVTIHVTGFKKFQGVPENPTERLVTNLRSYVEKRGLPAGVTLGSCIVLETAGEGALPALCRVIESGTSATNSSSGRQVVWVSLAKSNS